MQAPVRQYYFQTIPSLPFSFAKGVYSGVVDGITDETPFLLSFICKAMLESFSNGPGEALAQIWDCCPGGVDARVTFLLRALGSFWLLSAD